MPFTRSTLAIILLCLFTISGCTHKSGRGQSTGIVELTFWNGFSGPDGTTMEAMVRRFNQEHPRIRVRMEIIPWATYYDKVTLGLAYGGAPDVFVLHVNRFPEFAHYGSLNKIDDLVKDTKLESADFVPVAWNAGFWKGRQCAIPLDCHPISLYYNTDLFKEAGIVDKQGNAKPPEGLKEFLETARKLTKDTNGDGKPDQWGFAYTWLRTNAYTFMNQHDTGLLDKGFNHADISSPQASRAMGLMADIIYKHKVCPVPEGQDSWIGFQTGKVAMAMEGVYMLASLEQQKDLRFAAAPCPMFGKRRAVWGGSHLLTMPRDIQSEKREAAWEFIRYLSDHSLDWAKGGQVPVRKSILKSAEFRKLEVQYQFSRELPYVVYEPASVYYNQVAPFGDAAIEAVLCRIKPTQTALDEASGRIDKVLARR